MQLNVGDRLLVQLALSRQDKVPLGPLELYMELMIPRMQYTVVTLAQVGSVNATSSSKESSLQQQCSLHAHYAS